MSAHHKIFLKKLKEKKAVKGFFDNERYLLSGHHYYGFTVPERRAMVKSFLNENADISKEDFFDLVNALYKAPSYDEKTVASMLLEYSKEMRKKASFKDLDLWLSELAGWAEIDGFCSGTWSGEEMLLKWDEWERFIRKLSKDKNINKRRAALVFLIKPLGFSKDMRVLGVAFEIVDLLKHEKPIVITKAVSWVLRAAVKNFKKEVGRYVEENKTTLPKIAIRETMRKIATGRK